MRRGFDTRQLIWALAVLALLAGCGRASLVNDEAPDIEISLDLDRIHPCLAVHAS